MDSLNLIPTLGLIALALYLLVIAGMLLRWIASAQALGMYLLLFPAVLINGLFFLTPSWSVVVLTLMGPLFYGYTDAFFKDKIPSGSWYLLVISAAIGTIVYFLGQSSVASALLALYLSGYVYLIRRLVFESTRRKGITLFRQPGPKVAWFRNFALYQVVVAAVLWYHYATGIYAMTLTALAILIVGVLLVYLQVFRESSFFTAIPAGQKYAKSSLTADQKYSILNRLEALMTEEKAYVNPEVTLGELAEKLSTTSHNLSQVLNEQRQQSMAEYLMQYRIEEARRIIREDERKVLKIEDIALQVGYNSKSAFNTAFKRLTSLTPSEFRQIKNVRDYREERLAGRTIRHYGKAQHSFDHIKNQIDMARNFLLLFSRNLLRNKIFTTINLFGLVLGFTSSLFIFMFINDEMSYDRHLPESDQIYRIAWVNENPQTRTPHPMAQAMATDFPEVASAVTLSPWYGSGLSKQNIRVKNMANNTQFEEPDFYFVDSTFFDVFNFEMVNGNISTALKQPGGIIINQTMATKYFGNEDPLGKRLAIGSDEIPAEVVGVVKDVPRNTHFHFNFLISYLTLKNMIGEDNPWMTWGDFGHFNYVKLVEGSDPARLEAKIPEWFLGYNDWPESWSADLLSGSDRFALQPITGIHLHSNLRWELEANGNILYVYILSAAVLFILTIASINYINLTTAKSFERAKEIGVRKTLGALKGQLSMQFLVESVLFCLISGLLALLLSSVMLPYFNDLSGKGFGISDLANYEFLFFGLTLILIIGLLSGLYPSYTLSSFKPTEIIKGNFVKTGKGRKLNQALVTAQFIISTVLISSSLVILGQTNFLKEKPLGFEADYLVSIPIKSGTMADRNQTLVAEFSRLPGVVAASAMSNVPGGQFNQNPIWLTDNPQNPLDVSELSFDYSALETLGFELVDGRGFDKSYALDSAGTSFIINEAAVRQLQLTDPIGARLSWDQDRGVRDGRVVGVIKDFHYKSLHHTIQPLIMDMRKNSMGYFVVRIKDGDMTPTLNSIKEVYESFNSQADFSYTFVDQQIDDLYHAELRTLNIFGIFSGIALILASLGLLGIAISMMNQKVKEVGIRKVHGASTFQIFWLINRQFARLIGLALLIGLPVAFLLSDNWLAEFPYQVEMGLMPFLIAITILIAVSLITTSSVVMKVARTNPAEALKHE